ncbi:MAG: hypothetical protein P8010_21765 [Desulfosarcinaceae bacterium]
MNRSTPSSKSRTGLLVIALFLLAPVARTAAVPADQIRMVNTIGTATLKGSNTPAARQAAIDNGLVAAVDLALTDLVARDVVVSNFQLLNQSIYAAPNRFIQDFKVLAETSGGGEAGRGAHRPGHHAGQPANAPGAPSHL